MTADFSSAISELLYRYQPSKHPFFSELASCPTSSIRSSDFLNEFYKRYQAAMHATRVMVYFLPHLDTIDLRMAKFRVIADDDGRSDGDSHHRQLQRSWSFMLGVAPSIEDSYFGELQSLEQSLDNATADFVSTIRNLYARSLGAWVVVEGLAHDWIGVLCQSLKSHFPGLEATDYFRESYSTAIELRHAEEALNISLSVLSRRPDLINTTIQDAKLMAIALNSLWEGLSGLLLEL